MPKLHLLIIMNIVTLTSDWHNSDYYTATIKGFFLGNNIDINFVEITSKITNHEYIEAGFILKNTYKNFPDGTIHIIAVSSVLTKKSKQLLVKKDNQYFIGNDNGIFGIIFNDADSIIELPTNNSTFPELDVFSPVIIDLINGKNISNLGERVDKFTKYLTEAPIINGDMVICQILYFDSYGNAILNINKEEFEQIIEDKSFEIWIKSKRNNINIISNNYSDVPMTNLVAIFNSINLLEIAARNADAKQLFSLDLSDEIIIKLDLKEENILKMKE